MAGTKKAATYISAWLQTTSDQSFTKKNSIRGWALQTKKFEIQKSSFAYMRIKILTMNYIMVVPFLKALISLTLSGYFEPDLQVSTRKHF